MDVSLPGKVCLSGWFFSLCTEINFCSKGHRPNQTHKPLPSSVWQTPRSTLTANRWMHIETQSINNTQFPLGQYVWLLPISVDHSLLPSKLHTQDPTWWTKILSKYLISAGYFRSISMWRFWKWIQMSYTIFFIDLSPQWGMLHTEQDRCVQSKEHFCTWLQRKCGISIFKLDFVPIKKNTSRD